MVELFYSRNHICYVTDCATREAALACALYLLEAFEAAPVGIREVDGTEVAGAAFDTMLTEYQREVERLRAQQRDLEHKHTPKPPMYREFQGEEWQVE